MINSNYTIDGYYLYDPLFHTRNQINNSYYNKGLNVYYINNNKIKKGIISEVKNGKYFVKHFIFRFIKIEVFPGITCFLTKHLAQYILNIQRNIK